MKKKLLTGLVAGVLMFGVMSAARANTVVIPIELSAWSQFDMTHSYGSGLMERTSEGIKLWGNGYRGSAVMLSNHVADLSDAVVYIKWMVNGGSQTGYMGTGVGVANAKGTTYLGQSGQFGTTGWSYNGSALLPINTWLFTRIDYNPDMTYTVITSTENYDTLGGKILYNTFVTWGSGADSWNDSVKNGRLMAGYGDSYDGTTSWVLVGEAKYDRQSTCTNDIIKFTSGTPAKAADVNANFDALNCQIQALKAIVCKNEPTASICQ
ncbi:MAG: hypothetical protein WCR46_16375 [Deltaproteobacteria bacterium]|jgi:hypothetical protein